MKVGKRNSGGDTEVANIHGDKEAVEVPLKKRTKRSPRAGPSRRQPARSGSIGCDAIQVNNPPSVTEGDGNVDSGNIAVAEDVVECLKETTANKAIAYVELDEGDDQVSFPALPAPLNEGSTAENSEDASAAAQVEENEQPSASTNTSANSSTQFGTNGVRVKLEKMDKNDVKPIKGLDLPTIGFWLETQNREFIHLKQQLELQTLLRKRMENELRLVKEEKEEYDERIKEVEERMKELEERLHESQRQNKDLQKKLDAIKQMCD